jgi:hypothetical protein
VIPLALIHLHEAVDLIGVAVVTLAGAYGWSRYRRKDRLRRVERIERQAQFQLDAVRRQKEWDDAMRCFGIEVR